jgi:hypothetical protein
MDSLLQHLKPAVPASSSEAGDAACFLADLTENQQQGFVTFLKDPNTGRRWWVNGSLPYGQADTVQIDTEYARTDETDINVPAVLAEVDDLENNGAILVKDRQDQKFLLTEGFAAPPSPTQMFEVSHAGGNVWYVSDGEFLEYYGQNIKKAFKVRGERFEGTDGFIGFNVYVRPFVEEGSGNYLYEVQDVGPCFFSVGGYKSEPPTLVLPPSESLFGKASFNPGYLFCPLAYVNAPTDTRPATIAGLQDGSYISFARTTTWGNPHGPGFYTHGVEMATGGPLQ